MKKFTGFSLLFGLLVLLLTACGPITVSLGSSTETPGATSQATPTITAIRKAQVDKVEIRISQTEPIQVDVTVRGNFSESCATLIEPQTSYASNTFSIQVMYESPIDRGCAQILTPFEQTIQLDTAGLEPAIYTVVVNGVSATFTLPGEVSQSLTTIHLVVEAYDRSVKVVDASLPLNTSVMPYFGNFLPAGGSVDGIAYVIDPNNPDALAIGSNGPQVIEFIQNPAIYGLAVWPGSSTSQPRLAWGTASSGLSQSSSIEVSALDGSQLETLLTQDSPNPPTELVPEFWSADGQNLYFSKEPVGLGGNILFGGGSSLFKLDIATKKVSEVIPLGPSDGPQACIDAVSADYRYVADHCALNAITIRDLVNGISAAIQPPTEISSFNFLGSARFSPDGNHLAYALARTDQENETGWVALTQLNGGSKGILTSETGILYTMIGWLDDQTLLVQSINTRECIPDCATELWALKIDGSAPTILAQGKFLALIAGDLKAVPTPAGAPAIPAVCQDGAEYMGDDGMDGTTYAPNTAFSKTWTLKNIGTCTWDSSYLVYQRSGAYMTQQPGYWLLNEGQTVAPGQSVDISIGMTSPPDNGEYWSYWGLKDGAGQVVTVNGSADDASFYANIKVSNGSADTGKVTATSIDIVPEQGSGDACTTSSTYFVHVYIETDGPTSASYEIGSSGGQISAGYFESNSEKVPYLEGLLQFEKADKKAINLRFVGPYPYPDDIRVMLRVDGGEWVTARLYCP
jgi:hypothetical protein